MFKDLIKFNKNIEQLKQLYRNSREKFVTSNTKKKKFTTNNINNKKIKIKNINNKKIVTKKTITTNILNLRK